MPDAPPSSFPAVVVRRDDGAVAVAVEEVEAGVLEPDGVLVRVEWSGLNFKDAMVTQPGNRVARRSPLVGGVDLAGRVVSAPDPSLAPGTPVLVHGYDVGVAHHGGFAAYARVPPGWVVPLPPGLGTREAMIIGTAGFTSALSVDELERHGLTPPGSGPGPGAGDVLVTGASGGVGSFAVAILAGRGYPVVASSGQAGVGAWLRSLGAQRVVGREELDVAPGRTLGPELWAGAVDCVGGPTLARILRTLRYGAAVAASGLTGGAELETTVYPFITRHVALLGADSVLTPMARRRRVWDRLAGDLAVSDLDRFVDRQVTLDAVPGALADLLAGTVRGRVLVRVG